MRKYLLALFCLIAITPALSQTYPVTDNFSGSGPLSVNWTNTTAAGYVPLAQTSSTSVPSVVWNQGLAIYTGGVFGADQYSQVVADYTSPQGSSSGPCVRMDSAGDGVCWLLDYGAVYTLRGGAGISAVMNCARPAVGNTVQFRVVGTTYSCYINGVLNASGTDSTYSTGYPGFIVDQRNSIGYSLSYFQADCAPSSCSAPSLAPPTFNPAAGTYAGAQTVAISAAPSATIYYTADGTTPTTSSAVYSTPLAIAASATLKAFATTAGHGSSAVASAMYTITPAVTGVTAATPISTPAPGTFNSPVTVSLSCTTANSTIYYTTDGSTPTTSSTVYSSGIFVGTSDTISAICAAAGDTNSAVMTSAYIISAASNGAPNTWYVRPDGGTRYSANVPSGQCDGQGDAPYPGSGVNQHCAFGDYRFLYDDQSYGNHAWVISGGDTVILRGGPWRVGFDTSTGSGEKWCFGGGGPYGCSNPPVPAGTAAQPTRILGENYANCSKGNMTQLFGGHAVVSVLNLSGAQYVNVQCVEITDHAQCVLHGTPAYPSSCNSSVPLDDYADDGITTNATTTNVLLQDLSIHGLTDSGIKGPIGAGITMNRVNVSFNGFAGWNFDDGNDTPNGAGSSINANYVTMTGNGCNEEYPIADSFPAISCYDLGTGGFGDSWSGQDTSLSSFICNHCTQNYNTKDGFIGPHTQVTNLTITNSESYGNMGQQWKWGVTDNSTVVFENNFTNGNCRRMSVALPGAPSTYNAHLVTFCRAAGDIFSFYTSTGSSTLIANNTVIGYSATVFDFNCRVSNTCGSAPMTVRNNIVLGFLNTSYNPAYTQLPGLYYFSDASDSLNRDHNLYYNVRNAGCPSTGYAAEYCSDPVFVGEPALTLSSATEASLDNFNFNLTGGSPAIGAGVVIPGVTLDLNGGVRPNPPSIGALEFNTLATPASTPSPVISPAGGTYSSAQTVSITDAASGATIYYTLDGSIPTSSSPVYSAPILVSSNTTLSAMAVTAGGAGSAVASATFNIVTLTLTSISISPSAATVLAGATTPLTATCTYSDGSTTNCSGTANWTSSNGPVATVNGGSVTGVSAGSASISAAIGSISSNSTSITVTAPAPPSTTSLTVSQTQINFTPNVVVGLRSLPTTITVTNPTHGAAAGIAVSAPLGYLISSDQCSGSTLRAGASCTFSIAFAPVAAGIDSGNVTITATNVGYVTVAVSGTGVYTTHYSGF